METVISTKPLSYTEFQDFIMASVNWFTPSLQDMPNLNNWILKMYQNGIMYYFKPESNIVALVVTYYNTEKKFIYIPYVCVHPNYQGKGIAGQIISYIVDHLPINIHSIYLEVIGNNTQAIQLYTKMGFYCSENRGEKLLMKKEV